MPRKDTNLSKREALRRQGCLHARPEQVGDPLFQQSEFFDAHDLVQVKYEMLRRVQIEQQSVSQAAAAFGFSRPTYYQAELDFQSQGLPGLIPEKRGPRKAHKLTAEVLSYVQLLTIIRKRGFSIAMVTCASITESKPNCPAITWLANACACERPPIAGSMPWTDSPSCT